jgi:hypothetical protein
MGEQQDKLTEYWEEFDKLSKEKQLTYIWDCWGQLLLDVTRDWEPETLDESIKELKEMDKGWMWEAVFSNGGKPWSERYTDNEELSKGLKDFYEEFIKDQEDSFCDVKVYDVNGDDFSESQSITEMIAEIIGEEE